MLYFQPITWPKIFLCKQPLTFCIRYFKTGRTFDPTHCFVGVWPQFLTEGI